MLEFMEMTDSTTAPTVEARVKVLIVQQLFVPAEKVVDAARFDTDLDADSLDKVALSMAMEHHFDIEIPDREAREINTVAEAVAYIEQKLAS